MQRQPNAMCADAMAISSFVLARQKRLKVAGQFIRQTLRSSQWGLALIVPRVNTCTHLISLGAVIHVC